MGLLVFVTLLSTVSQTPLSHPAGHHGTEARLKHACGNFSKYCSLIGWRKSILNNAWRLPALVRVSGEKRAGEERGGGRREEGRAGEERKGEERGGEERGGEEGIL